MTHVMIHNESGFNPYIRHDDRFLQIISTEEDYFSPDVFKLDDGRICKISSGSFASMERTKFVVEVVHNENSRSPKNISLTGIAGTIYLNKFGGWELYPQERCLNCLNRNGEQDIISAHDKVNKRAAALKLIMLSDEASKDIFEYVKPDKGLTCGKWRYQPMMTVAAGLDYSHRPSKKSIKIHPNTNRHFLATLQGEKCSIRIIVEARDNTCEYILDTTVIGNSGESPVKVPEALRLACLNRCTL